MDCNEYNIKLISMQNCCGSGIRPAFSKRTKAQHPECHPENLEGKTQTADCGFVSDLYTVI
jgi:hypothetical protein